MAQDSLGALNAPRDTELELIEEAPIALVYDGITLAVMLATPDELEDFAIGFTHSEGISATVRDVDIVSHAAGYACHMSLTPGDALALKHRLRSLVGSSSCGLCGARSLATAIRAPATVVASPLVLSAEQARKAIAALRHHQPLHDRTRAAHAAALFSPQRGLILVREDVGRHNALDKLVGAALRAGTSVEQTALVLTSRVSVEMVQKAAALGVATIVAVSAPTSLAARMARAANIRLHCDLRRGGKVHGATSPSRPPLACVMQEHAR